MDKILIALLESSVALLLFYGVYAIWLKRETIFRENRFYLILSALISLFIPWINFALPQQTAETVMIYNLLDTISVSASGYEKSLVQQISAMQWVLLVYGLGVLLSLGMLVIKLMRITRLDKKSQQAFGIKLPLNVRFIDADVVPFSFLNKIYINPNAFTKNQLIDVIAHESVHVRQQHTYDCLFYELLIVLFWFHPIVYRYRTSAKEIHEYLADEGAIRSGISALAYQKLLFEQATGMQMLTLANSFNYSLVTRRLIMLTKIKSSKWAKARLIYVLPVLITMLLVFACNADDENAVQSATFASEQSEAASDADHKKLAAELEVMEVTENADGQQGDDEVFFQVDEMPQFPEGELALRKFIARNVKYPEKAKKTGTEGKVFIQFVVNEKGAVEQVKHIATRALVKEKNDIGEVAVVAYTEVFSKDGKAFDELEKEGVRVVASMPDWKPGKHQGKYVKVSYTIPINFKLD